MRLKLLVASLFIFSLSLLINVPQAAAQTDWAVVKTLPIGGDGGWDYLTVDPQTHRLYVPRSTHTMVIDGDSGARPSPISLDRSAPMALLSCPKQDAASSVMAEERARSWSSI